MSVEPKALGGTSIAAESGQRSPRSIGTRLVFVGIVLTVAWFVAIRQAAEAPDRKIGAAAELPNGASWWFRPVERNAFAALPAIGADLTDVAVSPAGDVVWVVGSDNFIARSADGGESWTRCDTPAPKPAVLGTASPDERASNPPSPAQVPAQKGLESVKQAPPQAQPPQQDLASAPRHFMLRSIEMLDARRGWVVGDAGTILVTVDGGLTWGEQQSNTSADLTAVAIAPDGLHGWAVGSLDTVLSTADGGATWTARTNVWTTGARSPVEAVAVSADGQRIWATGLQRPLARSLDAGSTWTTVNDAGFASLRSIEMSADGQRGWGVSDAFLMFATADGGVTWSKLPLPESAKVGGLGLAVHADGRRVCAVGWSIVASADGGSTWNRTDIGGDVQLASVAFQADGIRGWAVGPGTVLTTVDGGMTWAALARGDADRFASILAQSDGRHAWICRSDGNLLVTSDAGATWSERVPPKHALAIASGAAPDQIQIFTTGPYYETRDAGESWTELPAPFMIDYAGRRVAIRSDQPIPAMINFRLARLQSVAVRADGNGWAIVDFGLNTTQDGGRSWFPSRANGTGSLTSIALADASPRIWGVGAAGKILSAPDGGETWSNQSSGTTADLHWVAAQDDGLRAWIVGDHGTILATTNGGETWTSAPSGVSANLRSVAILSGQNQALAVGDNRTILALSPDGVWTPIETPYRRYPAPWAWALTAACGVLLLAPSLGRRRGADGSSDTWAEVALSDKPIEPGDPDPLEAHEVAGGVARFLANEGTKPPLTIAVTGAWGSGKSSLMNLIRGELRAYAFPTAWFNAWHHQSEQHLLGALMTSVQREAIPRWWTPQGIGFRLRLLALRGPLAWLPAVAVIGVCFLIAGALGGDEPGDSGVAALIGRATSVFGESSDGSGVSTSTVVGVGIGALVSFFALLRSLKMFSVSPSRIWALFTGAFTVRDVEAEIGFRQRFATVFEEVTHALQPRTLVIFVDDLDRCRPENAVQVLEMINFLVSHGSCCVVIGMAPEWVRRAVGLGFQQVAAEAEREQRAAMAGGTTPSAGVQILRTAAVTTPAGDGGARSHAGFEDDDSVVPAGKTVDADETASEIEACRARQEFAEKYLEKLINIQVPVPKPPEDALRRLLLARARAEERATPVRDRLRTAGRGLLQWAPVLLALVVAAAGMHYGPDAFRAMNDALTAKAPRALAAPSNAGTAPPSTEDAGEAKDKPGESGPTKTEAPRPQEPAATLAPAADAIRPGQIGRWRYWPFAFASGLLLMAGVAVLMRLTRALEKDTGKFVAAIHKWSPVLYAATPTPRAYKRFLNKARYYAMRQRRYTPPHTLLASLRRVWKRQAPDPQAEPRTATDQAAQIPEQLLVALSAIEHSHPAWLKADEFWKDPASLISQASASETTQLDWEDLAKTLAECSIQDYRIAFRRVSGEIDAAS